MSRVQIVSEDQKIVKLVRVKNKTRIVSLKSKLLEEMGIEPTQELYGRWKVAKINGRTVLVLEVYPIHR